MGIGKVRWRYPSTGRMEHFDLTTVRWSACREMHCQLCSLASQSHCRVSENALADPGTRTMEKRTGSKTASSSHLTCHVSVIRRILKCLCGISLPWHLNSYCTSGESWATAHVCFNCLRMPGHRNNPRLQPFSWKISTENAHDWNDNNVNLNSIGSMLKE